MMSTDLSIEHLRMVAAQWVTPVWFWVTCIPRSAVDILYQQCAIVEHAFGYVLQRRACPGATCISKKLARPCKVDFVYAIIFNEI